MFYYDIYCVTTMLYRFIDNRIKNVIQKLHKDSNESSYCNDIDCPNLSVLSLSRNVLETIEQITLVSIKLRVLYLVI